MKSLNVIHLHDIEAINTEVSIDGVEVREPLDSSRHLDHNVV